MAKTSTTARPVAATLAKAAKAAKAKAAKATTRAADKAKADAAAATAQALQDKAYSDGFKAGEALFAAQSSMTTVALRMRRCPGVGSQWSRAEGFPDWGSKVMRGLGGEYSRDRIAAGMLAAADAKYTQGGEPGKGEHDNAAQWASDVAKKYRADLKALGQPSIRAYYDLSASARARFTKEGGERGDANKRLSKRVGNLLSDTWGAMQRADDMIYGRKREKAPHEKKSIPERVAACRVDKLGELAEALKEDKLAIPEWLKTVIATLVKHGVMKAPEAEAAKAKSVTEIVGETDLADLDE